MQNTLAQDLLLFAKGYYLGTERGWRDLYPRFIIAKHTGYNADAIITADMTYYWLMKEFVEPGYIWPDRQVLVRELSKPRLEYCPGVETSSYLNTLISRIFDALIILKVRDDKGVWTCPIPECVADPAMAKYLESKTG